jgi:hypothetical protein
MDVILWSGGIVDGKWFERYIGPYKIAHWIRKHGYQAQVIDYIDKASEDDLYNITTRFITETTKILAVSTTFLSTVPFMWEDGSLRLFPEHAISVLKRIKDKHPNIKFVLGGYMSDKYSDYGIFDVSIMSYTSATEDIFLEYLNHLNKGDPLPKGEIIFPLYAKDCRRMHFNRANNPVYNIEIDDFRFIKEDFILDKEPLPMDISRGCIFACRFCQYPHLGKKKLDYIRGMNYIEEEMLYNYENFGTTSYYVLDDTFNDTEFKMQEFYNMSQRLPFNLSYSAYVRADLVHRFPNTAHLLKQSGLTGVFHGIESLHPEASKLVGKAWSGKHGKEFLPKLYHDIWNGEVAQHLSFITGITGDTKENIQDTIKWFIDNDLPSIKFQALGLFGNDDSNSRKTIQSEFDRNVEKYGYTVLKGGTRGRIDWKNDNWTNHTAINEATKAMENLMPYQKHAGWGVQPLMWYGISRETIATTKKVNMDNKLIRGKTAELRKIYFSKLLGKG